MFAPLVDPMGEGHLIERAGKGDHDAQLGMVDWCLFHYRLGFATLPEALSAAEVFARLAVTSGTATSSATLADLLIVRSNECADSDPTRAHRYMEEAKHLLAAMIETPEGRIEVAALLTRLADDGDDTASVWLNDLLDGVTQQEAVRLKREAKRRVKEAAETAELADELAAFTKERLAAEGGQ